MSKSSDAAPVDRRARRKAETRAKLVDAARAVFARNGIDGTRINDITEEADVGFGSFYNYFDSKDAIVAAVIEDSARAVGAEIDGVTAELDDAAEVVAVAHRTLLASAAADPDLGWLLVRLEVTHDLVSSALGSYAARDLKKGMKSGRFSVDDPPVALAASGGALLGVMRAMLQGAVGEEAGSAHAAGVLRLLGVPKGEAARIAARPLPALPDDD